MEQLVVEVIDAHDLMPKDGEGSASPFVEVDFQNHISRTKTVPKSRSHLESETIFQFRQNPKPSVPKH